MIGEVVLHPKQFLSVQIAFVKPLLCSFSLSLLLTSVSTRIGCLPFIGVPIAPAGIAMSKGLSVSLILQW